MNVMCGIVLENVYFIQIQYWYKAFPWQDQNTFF